MNLEPRTVELSRDNFNSAIESFLRSTDVIKDSETPLLMMYSLIDAPHDQPDPPVKITIHFKKIASESLLKPQETEKTVDHTVH